MTVALLQSQSDQERCRFWIDSEYRDGHTHNAAKTQEKTSRAASKSARTWGMCDLRVWGCSEGVNGYTAFTMTNISNLHIHMDFGHTIFICVWTQTHIYFFLTDECGSHTDTHLCTHTLYTLSLLIHVKVRYRQQEIQKCIPFVYTRIYTHMHTPVDENTRVEESTHRCRHRTAWTSVSKTGAWSWPVLAQRCSCKWHH